MKMTLMAHFRELRSRIIWSAVFFTSMFLIGLYISPFLRSIITAPLFDVWDNPSMIMTGIADGMMVEFQMAGLFAIFVSIPFLLWQLWRYVSPGLKNNERKIILPILVMSPVLFLTGMAFAYFILLPIMFKFFMSYGVENITIMPDMKNYLAFSIDLLKAFGLSFQFPLILVILNRAGVLSRKKTISLSRYIIVAIFVIGAALTPPDVVSQLAMSLPMVLLFGLSLLFMV
jgi:sec-independent protein translocase protein TatC